MAVTIPVTLLRALMTPGGFNGFDMVQVGTSTTETPKDQPQVIITPVVGYDAFPVSTTPVESLDLDGDPENKWSGLNDTVPAPTSFDMAEIVFYDSNDTDNAIRSVITPYTVSIGANLGVSLRLTVKQTV